MRLSPHTARTKTPKSIPSFLFHLSSPILDQTCLPQLQNGCANAQRRKPLLVLSRLARSIRCLLLQNYRASASRSLQLKNYRSLRASCRVGASFVYRMYRLASSRTKEAFWRARACADCRDYKPTPEATRFYSRLVGIGYRWGISIDRSSSPTSLTSIRYNFTSRPGQKKERASLGWPSYADAYFLFS